MSDAQVVPFDRPRTPKPGDLPPHSLDAEASVLADALAGGGTGAAILRNLLTPEMFFGAAHRAIAEAIAALDADGRPFDAVSVSAWLSVNGKLAIVGGMKAIGVLIAETPAVGDLEPHGRIVFELWQVRQLGTKATEIAAYCRGAIGEPRSVLDRARVAVAEITDRDPGRSTGGTLGASITEQFKAIVAAANKGEVSLGLSTGLRTVDDITTGMLPGQQWVIAARPGNGKTSLAMNAAVTVARAAVGDTPGRGVCVFTLEMKKNELAQRMLCSEARVDSRKLRMGLIGTDSEDWVYICQSATLLKSLPVWLDYAPGIDIRDLKSRARLQHEVMRKANTPMSLLIVDYLQLVNVESPKRGKPLEREQVVAVVARELKNLAGELDVPVLALCQMNRSIESRTGWPRMSDLRESGEIENAADLVAFLHKPMRNQNTIVFCIEKQRSGPMQARIPLKFYDYCTRFDDFDPGEDCGVSLDDGPPQRQARDLDPHTGKPR